MMAETGDVIYEKKANEKSSIASLTKLMTAMVIIDSNLDLNETVTITKDDFLIELKEQHHAYGWVLSSHVNNC